MTRTKKALLAGGLVVAGAAAFVVWQIGGPRMVIGMLRYDERKEGSLKPGDRAPDVSLARLDGSGPVQLSEFAGGKPLVIVFGSFT